MTGVQTCALPIWVFGEDAGEHISGGEKAWWVVETRPVLAGKVCSRYISVWSQSIWSLSCRVCFLLSRIDPQCAFTMSFPVVMNRIASWEGTLMADLAMSKPSLALRPSSCGGQVERVFPMMSQRTDLRDTPKSAHPFFRR